MRMAIICLVVIGLGPAQAADHDLDVYNQYMAIDRLVVNDDPKPRWLPDGSGFWYVPEDGDGTTAVVVDVVSLARRSMPKEKLADKAEPARLVWDRFPETSKPLYEVPAPGRTRFLTRSGHDIALRIAGSDASALLTRDGEADHYWTTEDAAWSADGRYVAVRKIDVRQVGKIPVVHWLGPEEQVSWHPYARAGRPVAQQALSILDTTSPGKATVVYAMNGAINVHGFRDGKLYFSTLSVDGKELRLWAYARQSATRRQVLTEDVRTYFSSTEFEEGYGAYYIPLDQGNSFLWLSERDGYRQIYLYANDGRLQRHLTDARYPVAEVVHVDETGGWIYYTAAADVDHPYDLHLMRVSLQGGRPQKLTTAQGHHDIYMSPTAEFFLALHSTPVRPPQLDLHRADGTFITTVLKSDIDKLRQVGWQPPEPFAVLASDQRTKLYGVLYLPHDFDPQRRYPVVQYVYGGSHISITPRMFLPQTHGAYIKFAQALGQLGYVVMVMDARGTPGRGKAFHDVAYRNIGRFEVDDYVTVLRQLAPSRPYMDLNKVGIFGLSFGGYYTVRAMLTYPDLYRVGVAGGPAVEMRGVYSLVSDPLLGNPQAHPARYDAADNRRLVQNLQGKLLIVQGTSDVNVPMAQPMKLIDALVKADKPYDLVLLPEQNHVFQLPDTTDRGFRHPYWWASIRRYFLEHLPPTGPAGD